VRFNPFHVRAFGTWVEVDGGGAFRDEGVAVALDDVEVISPGFPDELSEPDAGSERADVAEGGHDCHVLRSAGETLLSDLTAS
jgi:hypothetical protein